MTNPSVDHFQYHTHVCYWKRSALGLIWVVRLVLCLVLSWQASDDLHPHTLGEGGALTHFTCNLLANVCFTRRKKEGREPHARAEYVRKLHGLKWVPPYLLVQCIRMYHSLVLRRSWTQDLGTRLDAHVTEVKSDLSLFSRAKIYNKKRYAEKIQMKRKWDL